MRGIYIWKHNHYLGNMVLCELWNKRGSNEILNVYSSCTMYTHQDWLGLQAMDKAGKLHFLVADGDHLRFTQEFFDEKIIPYLQ